MNKLTYLAVVALVVALCVPSMAVENLEFGGQIESRGTLILRDGPMDTEFAQMELYLWGSADLADNVFAKINLVYQDDLGTPMRLIGPLVENRTWVGNVQLAEGYITLANMWDTIVTMNIGRWNNQVANELGVAKFGNRSNLIPKYGEGFVIPNNAAVDGMKFSLDLDPTVIDLLWVKNAEFFPEADDDDTLWGIYASTKAIENHVIDGYVLYNVNQGLPDVGELPINPEDVGLFDQGDILLIGARADGEIVADLGYKVEIAHSDLQVPDFEDLSGIGGYIGLDYTFAQFEYAPSVRLNFYYLDDEFIQPWGHVDQDDLGEKGYGRILDLGSQLTNDVSFVNLGATIVPADNWSVDLDYYRYWTVADDADLGDAIDLRLSYQYTENVAAELIGAYYSPPGDLVGLERVAELGIVDDTFMVKGGIRVSF